MLLCMNETCYFSLSFIYHTATTVHQIPQNCTTIVQSQWQNWTYSVFNQWYTAVGPLCPYWGNHNNIHRHTANYICTWGHCWITQSWFGWGKPISSRLRPVETAKVTPVIMWEQHTPLTQWWDPQTRLLIAPYWTMGHCGRATVRDY